MSRYRKIRIELPFIYAVLVSIAKSEIRGCDHDKRIPVRRTPASHRGEAPTWQFFQNDIFAELRWPNNSIVTGMHTILQNVMLSFELVSCFFSQFSEKNSNKMLHYFEIRIKCIFSIFSKFRKFREKKSNKNVTLLWKCYTTFPPSPTAAKKKSDAEHGW